MTVVEDASDEAWKTAQKLSVTGLPIVIDTPGFRSQATLACIAAADFLLVPVKASPLDIRPHAGHAQFAHRGRGRPAARRFAAS